MTTAQFAPSIPWGDRTALLPKKMGYVLSLDVTAEANGPQLTVRSSRQQALRHLFDEAVITMPEGLRCDIPTGRIERGDGEIGAPEDPSSQDLHLRLRIDLGLAGLLNVECVGVVN